MSRENLDFDDLVHRAWPAPYEEALGGWILRYADGVTKRANSVLPWAEAEDLGKAVDAAEEFYARRGLPCVFSMGPRAAPGLCGLLEERGYRVVDHTAYMVMKDPARMAASHDVERGALDVKILDRGPGTATRRAPGWCPGGRQPGIAAFAYFTYEVVLEIIWVRAAGACSPLVGVRRRGFAQARRLVLDVGTLVAQGRDVPTPVVGAEQ